MNVHAKAFVEKIEKEHDVTVLCIVEAGSRSWGFAGPDSDTDYLFIYKHPLHRYVSINPPSENISSADNSYQGYDLLKAGKLLYSCNPNLFYALHAPMAGAGQVMTDNHADFRELARASFNKKRMLHGTFGVATQHMGRLNKAFQANDLTDALKTTLHLFRYLVLMEMLLADTFIEAESYGYCSDEDSTRMTLLTYSEQLSLANKITLVDLVLFRRLGKIPSDWNEADYQEDLARDLARLRDVAVEMLARFKEVKFEEDKPQQPPAAINIFVRQHLGVD